MDTTSPFPRPYVISWNLTYRCNLACEHCYLDAGGKPAIDTPAFADRSELDTEACLKVDDELGAKFWNLYFLVPTGRGAHVSDLADAEYDRVLGELAVIQRRYAGRML